MDVPALTPDEALRLTVGGGSLLCLGVPEGAEVGIDMRSYAVGPRFKGLKMIPCGVHLATFGGEVERCGAFVRLAAGQVVVLDWDAQAELLRFSTDEEQNQRCARAVRRMEFDSELGPYPLATRQQWRALSGAVTTHVLRRAGIPVGTLVMPGGIGDELDEELAKAAGSEPPPRPAPRSGSDDGRLQPLIPCQEAQAILLRGADPVGGCPVLLPRHWLCAARNGGQRRPQRAMG